MSSSSSILRPVDLSKSKSMQRWMFLLFHSVAFQSPQSTGIVLFTSPSSWTNSKSPSKSSSDSLCSITFARGKSSSSTNSLSTEYWTKTASFWLVAAATFKELANWSHTRYKKLRFCCDFDRKTTIFYWNIQNFYIVCHFEKYLGSVSLRSRNMGKDWGIVIFHTHMRGNDS